MKRFIAIGLAFALGMSCFHAALALNEDNGPAPEERFYYIDNDDDCVYSPGVDVVLQEAADARAPEGYGIPSDYFMAAERNDAQIPLRLIADVSVEAPAQAIDMCNPKVPPVYYCVMDERGNSLVSPAKGAFSAGMNAKTVNRELRIEPQSLQDGWAAVPFAVAGMQKSVYFRYTFDNMAIFPKMDYSYLHGWITKTEYDALADTARKNPSLLPEAYFKGRMKHTLGLSAFADTTSSLKAAPDLSGVDYCDTADGKIRVYAYNSQGSPKVSRAEAENICDLFNKHAIRKNVMKMAGVTSIPQEDSARTVVYFNSSLGSGGITPVKDGVCHIEIGITAGKSVLVHEYMHVIQQNKFGMVYNAGRGWWMEGSADWAAAKLAGGDNYLDRLYIIQNSPWEAYDSGDLSNATSRNYGTAALTMFLQARNKNLAGKSYAKAAQYTLMRDALNAALNNRLSSEFAQYAIRMYRPAAQMTGIVPEAALWPEASCIAIEVGGASRTLTRSGQALGHLGVEYIRVQTDETGDISLYAPAVKGVQYWLLMRGNKENSWTYTQMAERVRLTGYNTKVKELAVAVINTSGSAKTDISLTVKVEPPQALRASSP